MVFGKTFLSLQSNSVLFMKRANFFRLLALLAVAALLPQTAAGVSAPILPELEVLDQTVKEAKKYMAAKQAVIDSLSSIWTRSGVSVERKWEALMEAGEQYCTFNADSALRCSEAALSISEKLLHEPDKVERSKIAVVNALSASGLFVAAESAFRNLSLSKSTQVARWKAGRQLYSYMAGYVGSANRFEEEYRRRYRAYDDSLLAVLPATDNFRQFISAERLIADGHYSEAKPILDHLLKTLNSNANLYGMAAYQMAEACLHDGNPEDYAIFLAKAAESDVKTCVSEGLALPKLAQWLYSRGDLDAAYRYINFSLDNAVAGAARMRAGTIARSIPIIDDAYRSRLTESRNVLLILLIITFFVLVACGVLLFVSVRQRKRLATANRALGVTGKTLESYVGYFLEMCSAYAGKLDSLGKLVVRKISSGQTEDLVKMVKTGKFADDVNSGFFRVFDQAFLDIFPDFVFNLNSLLKEEERFELKKGQGLPPELRIYAFVRLGVGESVRIAQILHYSPNTVYAYRNRVRNKAVNRDTFDEDVMKIGG